VSQPFLGEIILFGGNFAPRGWAFCNGQLLAISQNTALFSILGTTYGGDGQTNFALPDLRSRVPTHFGQGPGLSPYVLGQTGGTENVTLNVNQMPAHTHSQPATNGEQTTNRPNAALPAEGGVYSNESDGSTLHPTLSSGGSQPHNNIQPYLTLNYIIAIAGIFPSRN
jgi:microcystin-dependent protein